MFKTSSNFEKLLDKATSLTNLEPDWNSILQICDTIRQNDVQPRYALTAIKKKLRATNPNVQLMALQVLESCVKNCGSSFHFELATKEFMEELHVVLQNSSDFKVKDEILRLVQTWSHAFRKEPCFKAVQDEMRLMKAEGFQFPAIKENDLMFMADTAPEWSDGAECSRCRVQFNLINRKHHCRNCGKVYCAKCSSQNSIIPKYGIEKEVRVCMVCFEKINSKSLVKSSSTPTDETKPKFPASSVTTTNTSTSPSKAKTEQEIQEEEELQLALALSQSEAEHEKMRKFSQPTISSTSNSSNGLSSKKEKKSSKSSKSGSKSSGSKKTTINLKDMENEIEDAELAKYLNRAYWEQRSNSFGLDFENSPSPSAPQPLNSNTTSTTTKLDSIMSLKMIEQKKLTQPSLQDDKELETFAKNLQSTIEIFVNRLNSNKLRGRPITNDSGVQQLFMNLTNMHSHLMMYMQQTNEARSNCERLQDKINQIRDARAALDALRDEHREQLKRAAEEAERIRQQQMAQKLSIMRKQKQEYLQYQRELAIQRMKEQERELMMRTEQLKFGGAQQPPALQPWNIPPASNATAMYPSNMNATAGYYIPQDTTANYTSTSPHINPQQPSVMPTMGQPYASVAPPTNPSVVAPHYHAAQAPMIHNPMTPVHGGHMAPAAVAPPPPQMISPHTPYVPSVAPSQPPVAYMAPAAVAPGTYGTQPEQQPYNTVAVPQQDPSQQQPATQTSEGVKEELLINFD